MSSLCDTIYFVYKRFCFNLNYFIRQSTLFPCSPASKYAQAFSLGLPTYMSFCIKIYKYSVLCSYYEQLLIFICNICSFVCKTLLFRIFSFTFESPFCLNYVFIVVYVLLFTLLHRWYLPLSTPLLKRLNFQIPSVKILLHFCYSYYNSRICIGLNKIKVGYDFFDVPYICILCVCDAKGSYLSRIPS